MKRPLAVVGFAVLAVLCAAARVGFAVSVVLACLLAACGVGLLFISFKWRAASVAACLAAGAAFAFYALFWHISYYPAASFAQRTAQVTGTVTEAPVKSASGQSSYYLVRTETIKGDGFTYQTPVTLRVRLSDADIAPYSRLTFTAQLTLPPAGGDDGFDSQAYYRAKGVYLFAAPDEAPVVTPPGRLPLYGRLIALRQALSQRLQERVGGMWGALARGVLLGDVSGLSDEVRGDFTDAGLSHILAVSGTQTSLIAQLLLLLFARLRVPRRLGAVLAAATVLGFMGLTGFSPSVSRAGVMSILYLAAMLFGREADALNSLGASVLVLCALNPFAATDVGLLLSFSATLGLILFSGRLARWMDARLIALPAGVGRALRLPGGVLCETAGATAATLPVLLLTFRQVSLAALPANLLAVPASLAATLLAGLTALLPDGVWFAWLVRPAALLLRLCCAFMLAVAHGFAALPFAVLSTDYTFVYVLLAFASALAVLMILAVRRGVGRRTALRAGALCAALALSASVCTYSVAAAGVLEIAALPVDDGGCTVLLSGSRALLVDVDGYDAPYLAARWLKAHNVRRVDAVIFPVFDAQRAAYSNSLSVDVPARAAFLPGAYAGSQSAGAALVRAPTQVRWQGAVLTLYPSVDGKSLLTVVQWHASRAVITGGAAADLSAYALPDGALAADQLFYNGALSSSFIQAVSPRLAVAGALGEASTGGELAARGCAVRRAGDATVLARTRGGAFVEG